MDFLYSGENIVLAIGKDYLIVCGEKYIFALSIACGEKDVFACG